MADALPAEVVCKPDAPPPPLVATNGFVAVE